MPLVRCVLRPVEAGSGNPLPLSLLLEPGLLKCPGHRALWPCPDQKSSMVQALAWDRQTHRDWSTTCLLRWAVHLLFGEVRVYLLHGWCGYRRCPSTSRLHSIGRWVPPVG